MNIREIAFWTLDFLKGGSHRKNYIDISRTNFTQAITEEKINHLIEYAKTNVPFYKNMIGNSLSEFPVMNKDKYKEHNPDVFISQEFKTAKLHTVYTSGSTGSPFKVVQNPAKRIRVKCDLINCHNNIGWRLGDKFVFIRNWVPIYKQSALKSFIQNVHNVNTASFNDAEKNKLFHWLQKHKHSVLFGYASALYDFACYIKDHNLNGKSVKLKLAVCDSDYLTPKMREFLKQIFACPVYNRYDNEENGLLGISYSDEDGFKLNTQSLFFEILKLENDEPQEPGLMGRLVITDLFNYAMPLIRYDTGDLSISYDKPSNIKTLHQLMGRAKACIINTNGRLVSDVEISGALEPFTEIKKYQLIQETTSQFTFLYIGDLNVDRKESLFALLKNSLGEDAEIKISLTTNIALNKNGKYASTINKTLKTD